MEVLTHGPQKTLARKSYKVALDTPKICRDSFYRSRDRYEGHYMPPPPLLQTRRCDSQTPLQCVC